MTKLHCDLSDAVNIMCHMAGQGAGALIRCGDTPADTRKDPRWPHKYVSLLPTLLTHHRQLVILI